MPNRVVSRFANEKLERQNHSTFQFLVSNRLQLLFTRRMLCLIFVFKNVKFSLFKRDRESRRDESLVRFFCHSLTSLGKEFSFESHLTLCIYFHKSFHLFLSNSSCLVLLRLRVIKRESFS